MTQKKKSKFFTFICSFLPGAAEMYLGFMRMGFSLLVVFGLSILIPSLFRASDGFLMLSAAIWFFGFFHARNMASLDDEEFTGYGDRYIWEEFLGETRKKRTNINSRRWIAIALIVIGIAVLWHEATDLLLSYVPEALWDEAYQITHMIPSVVLAIIVILLGIFLIRGKKKELTYEEQPVADAAGNALTDVSAPDPGTEYR